MQSLRELVRLGTVEPLFRNDPDHQLRWLALVKLGLADMGDGLEWEGEIRGRKERPVRHDEEILDFGVDRRHSG